jgi:phthiodiolone/phenolphthiodiolone dimycocerosates ketoreductase
MVSFWPDALWTPEFTELAIASRSPHRHLDGLAVAAAAAALTRNAQIVTCVVDTVRRHPSLLAQTALTISHLSRGRFVLGLGSGEKENILPYGFDFERAVSRFEESLQVIRLLWESDGPVDFKGRFYTLEHARLDAEPYDNQLPPIWIGANGPRMLDIVGRYADGWLPPSYQSPEDYARRLKVVRDSAERAGRNPHAIVPAKVIICLLGDEEEIAAMTQAPLVKSYVLQLSAEVLRSKGHRHPMGDDWKGWQDIEPHKLTRERLLAILSAVDPRSILDFVPHGSPGQVAGYVKALFDAGLRVFKLLDYGPMAGPRFSAASAAKVRAAEDEVMRLVAN